MSPGSSALADDGGEIAAVFAGETEAVGGIGLDPHDVGGEPGLQRVGGVHHRDRAHGVFIAGGAGFRRGGGEHLEGGAEPGVDLAGGGVWEVREGEHGGGGPLRRLKGRTWVLV
jgi:hypothetical protein